MKPQCGHFTLWNLGIFGNHFCPKNRSCNEFQHIRSLLSQPCTATGTGIFQRGVLKTRISWSSPRTSQDVLFQPVISCIGQLLRSQQLVPNKFWCTSLGHQWKTAVMLANCEWVGIRNVLPTTGLVITSYSVIWAFIILIRLSIHKIPLTHQAWKKTAECCRNQFQKHCEYVLVQPQEMSAAL